jgi:hypothetical protein
MYEYAAMDWKPVRDGEVYCSPSCGGQCKWNDFILANQKAAALAASLGPNWKPHVHENLGWHWCARSEFGHAKVYESYNKCSSTTIDYNCLLGEDDSPGGKWVGWGKTPQDAVKAALKKAYQEMEIISDVLSNFEDFAL